MRIVQKFGGTSVGSIERIQKVAKRIKQWVDKGHQLAIVVSAMSGETNRLLALSNELAESPNLREQDALIASGEQVSMALLAIALESMQVAACSFTGWQAGIRTTKKHGKSRILEFDCKRIESALSEGKVAIMAGFQGINAKGDITTLGRGGSDTSAVALAAALAADECQIYTDVDGIYTTDPRIVPEASQLSCITYEEILEMASLGAKVLQIRSVELAYKKKVPIRVLSSLLPCTENSLSELGGTLIMPDYEESIPAKSTDLSHLHSFNKKISAVTAMENRLISGIAFNKDEAQIRIKSVKDQPGVAYSILGRVAESGIEVDMIVQNISDAGLTDFTFTVHRNDYHRALDICQNLPDLTSDQVTGNNRIVKVSLVGVGMRSHAGIAAEMFKALKEADINILLISTSEIKISVCIQEDLLKKAVTALHRAFKLDQLD